MSTHYFTEDGSYGHSDEPLYIDTTDWTKQDWEEVEDAWDSDKYWVAKKISQRYTKVTAQ